MGHLSGYLATAASVEKIQGVAGIIDEIDANAADVDEPKQRAGSRRIASTVQQYAADLVTTRCGFHQKTIVSVDRQDVAVRRNREAERIVEAAALRDRRPDSGGGIAEPGMSNSRNPIIETIGHIESVGIGVEAQARRPNHQRRRIGPFGEAGSNHGNRLQDWHRTGVNIKGQPDHGSFVHNLAPGGYSSVQDIGDEQICRAARRPTLSYPKGH